MVTKSKELAEAILKLIEQSVDSREAANKVAAYLVTERRTKELGSLLRTLEELRFKRDGVLEVTATVNNPLSETAKDLIKKIFSADGDGGKVIIHEEINKQTLGGVRVRALDKVADFSVRARLQRLRHGANDSGRSNLLRSGRSL